MDGTFGTGRRAAHVKLATKRSRLARPQLRRHRRMTRQLLAYNAATLSFGLLVVVS
jgi:hypothetical protein